MDYITIQKLLSELHDSGVKIWRDGDRLCYQAPKGVLTPDILQKLRKSKAEILTFLQDPAAVNNNHYPPILPVKRSGHLPLSFAQTRLWFLDQLGSHSSTYNISVAYRLKGFLNLNALEKSFNEIVRRHEILRTRFSVITGQPHQVIASDQPLTLSALDLQGLSVEKREVEINRQATEAAQKPFDLAQGPLFRVKLLCLAEQEHVLLLNMHHIVSDEWSFNVIFYELRSFYEAFSDNKPPSLPELSIQYADFAYWQREWLQGDVLKNQLNYWKQQLSAPLPVVQLPTDRPRSPVQTYRGARQSLLISPEVTNGLKTLCQHQGVTLFMVLLAAFKVLLYRYSSQSDIIVGTPIADRKCPEIENLIGFFVNTLVLRTDLSGNPSFRELLSRVCELTLAAYAHQDLPFEKLVEELRPERDPSCSPLFQVMFALQNAATSSLELPGLVITPCKIETNTAKFDLILSMQERGEELIGIFEYNTDLFDDNTITRMMQHFERLLEGIVANPEQRLSDIPILSSAERYRLLVNWNENQCDFLAEQCIHELFEEQVQRTPDAVAVVFGDKTLTYQEVNHRANQLAHYLQKLGVTTDVLVGICVEPSVEMVIGLLGILKAGGAYLPLDPTYPKERLRFMLEDAQVSILLTQNSLFQNLLQYSIEVVDLEDNGNLLKKEKQDNPGSEVTSHSLAYVVYTSGSTGKPKGVAVPHRAVNRLVCQTNYVALQSTDRIAQASNISFDAFTFEIWSSLSHGAQLVGIPKDILLSPQDLATQLRDKEISVLFLTTALFNQLARIVPEAFSSLRYLLFGGEVVELRWVKEVLEKGRPQHFLHVYGPTENTTFSSYYPIEEVKEVATTIPIGRPISNTQIYLLDQHLQPVPIGIPGELHVGGDGLARGYLNRPELTAEKFIANPFSEEQASLLYKTGDLARYLPDGNIEFLGRLDNQVKIRGFRIELGEIEAVLAQHPDVKDVVAVNSKGAAGDGRLLAYIVPKPERLLAISDLRCFIKQKLPNYMIPSAFIFLEALPLNSNGKVSRRELPLPNDENTQTQTQLLPPQDALELQLLKLCEQILNCQNLSLLDNFFDCGGNSLLAVQFCANLEKVLPFSLPVTALFQAQTIQELAGMVRNRQSISPSSLVIIRSRGSKLPLFFINSTGQARRILPWIDPERPLYSLNIFGLRSIFDNRFDQLTLKEIAHYFLKDLRTIQPSGPYQLVGYCQDAPLTLELAQQIQQQNESVSLLCLIDGFLRPSKRQLRNRLLAIREFGWFYFWERLQTWLPYGKIRKNGNMSIEALSEAERLHLLEKEYKDQVFYRHYLKQFRAYQPQPYYSKVVLLLSSEHRKADTSWLSQEIAPKQFEVQIVKGLHGSLFKKPYVENLAKKLEQIL